MNTLRDAAASAPSRISVTNDNYSTYVGKEKFGKREAIVEILDSQLKPQPIDLMKFM